MYWTIIDIFTPVVKNLTLRGNKAPVFLWGLVNILIENFGVPDNNAKEPLMGLIECLV